MNTKPNDSNVSQSQTEEQRDEPPLEIDTRKLLGSRREVTIIHHDERYRLRITSQNRLILTK